MARLAFALLAAAFTSSVSAAPNREVCGNNSPANPTGLSSATCARPITQHVGSSPALWSPWTHRPWCRGRTCVYTSASVPSGRGLSIIGTPETAAGPLNILSYVLDGGVIANEHKKRGMLYRVQELPGKGLGAVARRKIPKDTAILVDRAVMLSPVEWREDISPRKKQELFERAVAQLGDEEVVRGLSKKGTEGVSEVEDVMLTNTFGVTIEGEKYVGLFPTLARFNHGCRPNAFTHFSPHDLAMIVWTSADIQAGEEITITYVPSDIPLTDRHAMLQRGWGFHCTCALCTSNPAMITRSDSRRKRLHELRQSVSDDAAEGRYAKAIADGKEMLKLAEEEKVLSQYGDVYELLGMLNYEITEYRDAIPYLQEGLRQVTGFGDVSDEDAKKAAVLRGLLAQCIATTSSPKGKGKKNIVLGAF